MNHSSPAIATVVVTIHEHPGSGIYLHCGIDEVRLGNSMAINYDTIEKGGIELALKRARILKKRGVIGCVPRKKDLKMVHADDGYHFHVGAIVTGTEAA